MAAKPRGNVSVAGVGASPKRAGAQRSVWRGYETKRAWAYALTNDGITQFDLRDWRRHRRDVACVLNSIRAAFRLRHDPHVGKFARLALKAQLAALAVFDPTAPDFGAGAFDLAFAKFEGKWNALVATNLRAMGDAREAELLPLAEKCKRFPSGKPKGARAPLTKAIAAYLRKHPKATAEDVWAALKDRPPAGFTFCDNRLGRYIEHGAATAMQWERFRNAVSENRPASAKRVTKRAPAFTE